MCFYIVSKYSVHRGNSHKVIKDNLMSLSMVLEVLGEDVRKRH